MSTTYRYQEAFASDLTAKWLAGQRSEVRIIIRQLKNKAQAAYIAAAIMASFWAKDDTENGIAFVNFMHPNE